MSTTLVPINPRLLIVEVWDNGKISLPQYMITDNQTITIPELTKARDFIDLMIANPQNFHIVRPEELKANQPTPIIGFPTPTGDCFKCSTMKATETLKRNDFVVEFLCDECYKAEYIGMFNPKPVISVLPKPTEDNYKAIVTETIQCRECEKGLNHSKFTNTERENKLCFDCEKRGILDATDKLCVSVVQSMVEAEDSAILNEPGIGKITPELRKRLNRI